MPEFEAIIQGETGDFFEENNLDNLVKTIENWIEKYPKKNKDVIDQCYKRIDDFYNPNYQVKIFKETLFENTAN